MPVSADATPQSALGAPSTAGGGAVPPDGTTNQQTAIPSPGIRSGISSTNTWSLIPGADQTYDDTHLTGAGPVPATPETISANPNTTDIFWRGSDNGLWHYWFDGSNWNGPQEISAAGIVNGNPMPISSGANDLEVFWRGFDLNLWYTKYSAGTWQPASRLLQTLVMGDPHPVSAAGGTIDVFFQGADWGVWDAHYEGNWSGALQLTHGVHMNSEPQPAVIDSGATDIFWQGQDANLWYITYNNGTASAPATTGFGPMASPPAAVSGGPEHADVLWRGTDNELWDANWQLSSGWSAPAVLAGPMTGTPTAVKFLLGNIDVAYRAPDNEVWHDTFTGSWSGPIKLFPSAVVDTISATAWAGHPEFFWRSPMGDLWEVSHDMPIQTNYIPAPVLRQSRSLDCEAAALQVALAAQGTSVSQDWELGQFGADLRPAVVVNHNVVQWGDPFQSFVGNVNGSEPNYTGYGVYWPPLQRAAITAGHYAQGGQNWSAREIYLELSEGHPVVIWTDTTFTAVPVRWWTAWDGAAIPYAVGEHAVTLTGIDVNSWSVQLVDVGHGVVRTFSMAQFQSFWTTFSDMAVVVD